MQGDITPPPQPSPEPSKQVPYAAEPEVMQPAEPPAIAQPTVSNMQKPRKKWFWLLGFAVVAVAIGLAFWLGRKSDKPATTSTSKSATQQAASTSTAQGLKLDTNKNYGEKYASGVLPVGDKKYQTTGAKAGYVYACSQYAQNLASDSGGAQSRGPWFSSDGSTYDINKKAHVAGSVSWQSSFSDTVNGSTRTITSNNLPNHITGVFPIATSDPAYVYDKNPNKITAQNFTYSLAARPTYGSPQCMGGQVGVMLTGVALFNGFDAGGRDAGAWEVQDGCSGHPEKSGTYHYHTLSSCIKDTGVSTVIGFALDGFPITGPKVGPNNILTTSDLDECHGLSSQITLGGKKTIMYHYVMTQDFPYSVSCFRATPIQPPGLGQGGSTQQQQSPEGPPPRP